MEEQRARIKNKKLVLVKPLLVTDASTSRPETINESKKISL
jgi:hypothetical protein